MHYELFFIDMTTQKETPVIKSTRLRDVQNVAKQIVRNYENVPNPIRVVWHPRKFLASLIRVGIPFHFANRYDERYQLTIQWRV